MKDHGLIGDAIERFRDAYAAEFQKKQHEKEVVQALTDRDDLIQKWMDIILNGSPDYSFYDFISGKKGDKPTVSDHKEQHPGQAIAAIFPKAPQPKDYKAAAIDYRFRTMAALAEIKRAYQKAGRPSPFEPKAVTIKSPRNVEWVGIFGGFEYENAEYGSAMRAVLQITSDNFGKKAVSLRAIDSTLVTYKSNIEALDQYVTDHIITKAVMKLEDACFKEQVEGVKKMMKLNPSGAFPVGALEEDFYDAEPAASSQPGSSFLNQERAISTEDI